MIRYTRDNRVSPVIAILLILVMAVVAAGITAVVATGMTDDLQNGKQVGLIVKPAARGGDVLVTVVSGKDVLELKKLEVIGGCEVPGGEVFRWQGGCVGYCRCGICRKKCGPGLLHY